MSSGMNAIAYRRGSEGFQKPSPAPDPYGTPANDNRPSPVGAPANDNVPKPDADFGRRLAMNKMFGKMLLRGAGLLNPLSAFQTGMDLGLALMRKQQAAVAAVPQHWDWTFGTPDGHLKHTHCFFCDTGPHSQFSVVTVLQNGPPNCTVGVSGGCTPFQVPSGAMANGDHVTFNWTLPGPVYNRKLIIYTGPSTLSGTRMTFDEADVFGLDQEWVYPGTTTPQVEGTWWDAVPAVDPLPIVWSYPYPAGVPYPAIDPFSMPVARPMPRPRAVPWPMLPNLPKTENNPWRSPVESSHWGPKPLDRPRGKLDPIPDVKLPPPLTKLKPARPVPPKPREREAKVKLRNLGGIGGHVLRGLQKLMHAGTEFNDYTDALYQALPYRIRAQYGQNQREKLRALYDHLGDLDWSKAGKNLLINEIGDRILGRLQGSTNRNLSRYGVTMGKPQGPRMPKRKRTNER